MNSKFGIDRLTANSVSSAAAPKRKRPASIFFESEEALNDSEQLNTANIANTAASSLSSIKTFAQGQTKTPYASSTSSARRTAAAHDRVLAEDATAFDYDAVYDQLKAHENTAREAKRARSEKPQYMQALLKNAAVRKIQRMRADERIYRLQRDADGTEYGETEEFITGAYKEALEQVRALEVQQDAAEIEDQRRRASSSGIGMSSFYRDLLEKSDAERRATTALAVSANLPPETVEAVSPELLLSGQLDVQNKVCAAVSNRFRGIRVNASGEIVDKRDLLATGLNRPVRKEPPSIPCVSSELPLSLLAQTDSNVVKSQLAAEQSSIAIRGNDSCTIDDARARYIARRKAASASTASSTIPT